jgi:hypothetical protein
MRTMLTAALLLALVWAGPARAEDEVPPAKPKPDGPKTEQPKPKTKEPGAQPKAHPLHKDKTGLLWVLPFTAAKAKAVAGTRILMIKPVAFGTSADGGW